MPVYEFECPNGHLIDKIVALRDLGDMRFISCDTCGKEGRGLVYAERVLSATKTNFRHNDRSAFKG